MEVSYITKKQKRELKKEKKTAIQAAKELQYDEKYIEQLTTARSSIHISQILADARTNSKVYERK